MYRFIRLFHETIHFYGKHRWVHELLDVVDQSGNPSQVRRFTSTVNTWAGVIRMHIIVTLNSWTAFFPSLFHPQALVIAILIITTFCSTVLRSTSEKDHKILFFPISGLFHIAPNSPCPSWLKIIMIVNISNWLKDDISNVFTIDK